MKHFGKDGTEIQKQIEKQKKNYGRLNRKSSFDVQLKMGLCREFSRNITKEKQAKQI